MKRLATALVASAFALTAGVALLSGPAVAVAHPGNTCTPPAGHGRSGCHQVTASPSAASQAKATAAAQAKTQAAQRQAVAKRASAAAAAPVTPPAPVTVPGVAKAPVSAPWWIALWHFLVG